MAPCSRPQTEDGESVFSCSSGVSHITVLSFRRSENLLQKSVKLQPGCLDKPKSEVLQKLRWPHMNQNPCYVTNSLMFNQLTFPQFVGGECRTVLKTSSSEEMYGRLSILSKISYLYDQCRSWEKARAAYFAIISSIEEGEVDWSSSFGHYDIMCLPVNEVDHKDSNKNA